MNTSFDRHVKDPLEDTLACLCESAERLAAIIAQVERRMRTNDERTLIRDPLLQVQELVQRAQCHVSAVHPDGIWADWPVPQEKQA